MDVLTAVLAMGVALGYYTIAALIVPRINLDEATPRFVAAFRIGGVAFFVGCGLTHSHIAYHAIVDDQEVGVHEALFHLLQVFGVWLFIYAALRFLEVRVTRRKTPGEVEAEQLRRRVRELSRSNRDLEHFAHIVAHDLQEPLRSVSGFATLLERSSADRLDPRGAQSLRYIRDGTLRMSAMLDSVLAYSRVASVGLRREPINLEDVLHGAEQALGESIAERGAVITADPLPVVEGDRTQLDQLVQNLLANAIKFGPESGPRIHVWAEAGEAEQTIAIRDNGPGIDDRDAERVFEMFSRGATVDGRPGSGVGLAVCAKIVDRHGGRLWHEPAEGGGTVFRFTLPVSAEVPVPAHA
jgi:signal transduction histidine kinase